VSVYIEKVVLIPAKINIAMC